MLWKQLAIGTLAFTANLAPCLRTEASAQRGTPPAFSFTPKRIATMQRMRAEGHHLWRLHERQCAATGTPKQSYFDSGLWCLPVYVVTGDAAAAQRGIKRILQYPVTPPNGNEVRERFGGLVLMTAGYWPAMTSAQRASARAMLDGWAKWATGKNLPMYAGGFRLGDSDQSVSTWFSLALLTVFNEAMGFPGRWVDSVSTPQGGERWPIGGFAATAATQTTARNNVAFYSRQFVGGEWNESAAYNEGTLQMLIMGDDALTSQLGRSLTPEFRSQLPAAGRAQAFMVTPDLMQPVQWGDEEKPHDLTLYNRTVLLCMLSPHSPDAHRLLLDLWKKHGTSGYGSAEPVERCLPYYDPDAPVAASPATGRHVATGRGHLYVKDATTLFFAQGPNPQNEDHQWQVTRNIMVYHRGAWWLDHPHGYGGVAADPVGQNGLSLAGFGAMPNRAMVRVDSGDGWSAITSRTSGCVYVGNFWEPPPCFVKSALSTQFVTKIDGSPVVIVRDSVDMSNPLTMPRIERYYPADRARIDDAKGGWWAIWHMPKRPTATADGHEWTTAGRLPIALHTFGATESVVLNENALWKEKDNGTRGWQVRTRGERILFSVLADPALTVRRNGNSITVGPRTITITSAGVTVR